VKAAIALLLEGQAHAAVRRVALELHEVGFGLSAAQLPAHVSLKQPFQISSLSEIEAFFDAFAASLEPVDLTLSSLEFWNADGVVIAFLDVLEDAALRPMHNRLNAALEAQFGPSPAPFDGESYHFHATTVIDHANDVTLAAMQARAGERCDLGTTASSLGLFVYTDDDFALSSFVSYKTLRLEFKASGN
jgi:2'-5' RNA ligase